MPEIYMVGFDPEVRYTDSAVAVLRGEPGNRNTYQCPWLGVLGEWRGAELRSAPRVAAVIECPQVYSGPQKKQVDPNDLIRLAVSSGRFLGELSGVTTPRLVLPREWSQLPKRTRHLRATAETSSDVLPPALLEAIERCSPGYAQRVARSRAKDPSVCPKGHDQVDALLLAVWGLDNAGSKYWGRV